MITKILLPLLVLISSFINPDSIKNIQTEEFPPESFKGIWTDSDEDPESLLIIEDVIKIYTMYDEWEMDGEIVFEEGQLFIRFYEAGESVRFDATDFTIEERSLYMAFINFDDEHVSMTIDLESDTLKLGANYSDEESEFLYMHKIETSPLNDQ